MNCPNCSNGNISLFHDKVWSIDNGKVYQCSDCELIFINPMMSLQEESKFYKNYNQHVKDRGVIAQNSVREFHEKSKEVAEERLNIVKKYFKNKKVLEIGSSTGAFLSLLSSCQTNACELSGDNLEFSKQFINGNAYTTLDDISDKDFDLICMFHVFEHIRTPLDFLYKCKSLLKSGGHILIEVPCSDDPLITIYNCEEFKDFVFQPMHPMIYNEKSLDYVFTESGFLKQNVIYYQRYGLENHLSWLKNKKPGGDENLKSLFGSNIEYKKKLEFIKATDTIFYIGMVND